MSTTIHRQTIQAPATGDTHDLPIPDSYTATLDATWLDATLQWWDSAWSGEWEPRQATARSGLSLAPTAGRSSARHHPFVILEQEERAIILAVAWSGNWQITLTPHDDGLHLSAGLPHGSQRRLTAGQHWATPDVIVTTVTDGGLAAAHQEFIAAVRDYLGPQQPITPAWNHWWPYEDHLIDAPTFTANAQAAAQCGLGVAILDAGWFGTPGAPWSQLRGDWDQVNTDRFPDGLGALAHRVRATGIEFGLWIESESIGEHAHLRTTHPELIATGIQTPLPPRPGDGPWAGPWPENGTPPTTDLGYLCLGNAAAREMAVGHILRLAAETGLRWLKLDFNTDPGLGCTAEHHGHGPTDGLIAHIEGLYTVLDQIRRELPQVVIETCASGGMRWDLGIARHCDLGFMSDTDWPEHAVSVFWGAAHVFPPERLYGWCDSQWAGQHAHQNFHADTATPTQVSGALAIALLGQTGLSQRLIDWSASSVELVRTAMMQHREVIGPALATSTIHRHGPAPRRFGQGNRWPVIEWRPSSQANSPHLITSLPLDGPQTPRPTVVIHHSPGAPLRLQPLFPSELPTVEVFADEHGRVELGTVLGDRPAWYQVVSALS